MTFEVILSPLTLLYNNDICSNHSIILVSPKTMLFCASKPLHMFLSRMSFPFFPFFLTLKTTIFKDSSSVTVSHYVSLFPRQN